MAAVPCDGLPPVDLPVDPFGEAQGDYIRADGLVPMIRPLRIANGVEEEPGLSFEDNTRSGLSRDPLTEDVRVSVDANRGLYIFVPDKRGEVAILQDIPTIWEEATNSEAFTIVAGRPLKVSGDGTVALARANSVANLAWAFAAETMIAGGSARIVTHGIVSLNDWTVATGGSATLTPGSDYFLSPSTAGIITVTSPSAPPDIAQLLGRALSSTELILNMTDGVIL